MKFRIEEFQSRKRDAYGQRITYYRVMIDRRVFARYRERDSADACLVRAARNLGYIFVNGEYVLAYDN